MSPPRACLLRFALENVTADGTQAGLAQLTNCPGPVRAVANHLSSMTVDHHLLVLFASELGPIRREKRKSSYSVDLAVVLVGGQTNRQVYKASVYLHLVVEHDLHIPQEAT